MTSLNREYRVYFHLWGRYWLRTNWRILYSQTEFANVRTVRDSTWQYHFRGLRPRIIMREHE